MAHFGQQQAQAAYPRPSEVYYQPPQQCYQPEKAMEMHSNVPYVAPPPPVGYPTTMGGGAEYPQHAPPVHTQSKGDGFWKGCVAALCCCWVLDVCLC